MGIQLAQHAKCTNKEASGVWPSPSVPPPCPEAIRSKIKQSCVPSPGFPAKFPGWFLPSFVLGATTLSATSSFGAAKLCSEADRKKKQNNTTNTNTLNSTEALHTSSPHSCCAWCINTAHCANKYQIKMDKLHLASMSSPTPSEQPFPVSLRLLMHFVLALRNYCQ